MLTYRRALASGELHLLYLSANTKTIKQAKTILDLKKGEFGIITEFEDPILASKLLPMGILPESKIQFVRKAPFGGAIYLKLNGFALALRTEEAASILIKCVVDE